MRKVILLFGILFSVVPRAESDPVTLSGTGVFDFVSTVPGEELQPLLGFNVAQGEAFTFSFDFSSPPTLDFIGEGFAFYALGLSSVSVTVGTRSATLSSSGGSGVVSDNSFDRLSLSGGLNDYTFGLFGFDPSGQWLDSVLWPDDAAAVLNAAPQSGIVFIKSFCTEEECGESVLVASGSAEHMTQSPSAPIPEPTSLVLLASGLLGAVGARHWRQRKT